MGGCSRYAIKRGDSWPATRDGDELALWLPPDYRPGMHVIQGRMLALVSDSGGVVTIGFSEEV